MPKLATVQQDIDKIRRSYEPPRTAAASPPRPPTNYRLQGIAAALGALAREHMEPHLAAMVLDSLGLTLADLKAAGADTYDLEPLQ
jgi:hypothetical protein